MRSQEKHHMLDKYDLFPRYKNCGLTFEKGSIIALSLHPLKVFKYPLFTVTGPKG